jgi:hypothetical protein
MYPNPADGEVLINMNSNLQNTELSLYNGLGEKVFEKNYKHNEQATKINTSTFSNGLYQVVLKQNGKVIDSKKLVVGH